MSSGIRMSGMVSGIDTEAIVQAMVSTHVAKKEKYQKAQTKLEWKQDAYKAINTKVYSLYNKVSNLRFSSAYKLKKTTVSDATKATITSSGQAINGTQTLQIKQLAQSGYLTGGKLKSGTKSGTTLGELGYTGSEATISVRTGKGNTDIKVSKETTIEELVSSLNNSGVKANFDETNGRIFVSASGTGVANDFSLTASDMGGLQALAAAGLSVESEANMAAYKASAAYAMGTKGINENGDVVSYFQLDGAGNILYDESGKALVNEGVTFSAAETQKAIKEILENCKNAGDENTDLALERTNLNQKIAYSNAKDAVDTFINDLPEEKKADGQQLLKLLEEAPSKYKYVTEEGEIKEDFEFAAGDNSLENTINKLAKELGLITTTTEEDGSETEDSSALTTFRANYTTVLGVDGNELYTAEDKKAFYLSEEERAEIQGENGRLAQIDAKIAGNNAILADSKNAYWNVGDYTNIDIDSLAAEIAQKITTAKEIVEGNVKIPISDGATRVDAKDAKIILNNAEFVSDSNTFNINGLTIKATGVTKDDETLTISTDTDTQGMYDKIKDFLSQYNEVINELCSLYNAESAAGYEPLTDDEKESMSDSEIEKWETKIKEGLLRRDSTIGGVMNAMTQAMSQVYEVNGKKYSLSSFGIKTMGYLYAAKNENYAYHIDGDSEDEATSGNADKLMNMINSDPEAVEEFMKSLTSGLYKALDDKMKSTTMSSAYTIYNDKQMTKDYKNYATLIKEWESKIEDLEDRYYKQYSNMEKQLAQLQSSTSSLSGLLGTS